MKGYKRNKMLLLELKATRNKSKKVNILQVS